MKRDFYQWRTLSPYTVNQIALRRRALVDSQTEQTSEWQREAEALAEDSIERQSKPHKKRVRAN